MPLIATVGAVDANSFCTIPEAWTFLATELDIAAWQDAPGYEQEAALLTATRKLVESVDWYGAPTTTTQALPWPQQGAWDRSGRAVLSTVIPTDIKRATALYALALLREKGTSTDLTGMEALDAFRRGTTTLVFRKTGRPVSAMQRIPAEIRALLSVYGDVAGGATVRLTRT